MLDKVSTLTVSLALQPAFPGLCPVTDAVEKLATDGGIEERGAIFTKREVVDFILDLTGYVEAASLTDFRLLEPSFGDGDFLLPVIDRLLAAAVRDGKLTLEALAPAIRAIELHRATYDGTRALLTKTFLRSGLSCQDAVRLCDVWLMQGDFLLADLPKGFTHVVGNPPYVRQESIPDVLMSEYRKRFKTIYDRADIYVPFIERSLALLGQDGQLGFICADRWMKNKYGKKLRELVSNHFSLKIYVDMVGTDPFHAEVSAYPAITIIEKSRADTTRVFARPAINADALKCLAADLTANRLPAKSPAREITNVAGTVT